MAKKLIDDSGLNSLLTELGDKFSRGGYASFTVPNGTAGRWCRLATLTDYIGRGIFCISNSYSNKSPSSIILSVMPSYKGTNEFRMVQLGGTINGLFTKARLVYPKAASATTLSYLEIYYAASLNNRLYVTTAGTTGATLEKEFVEGSVPENYDVYEMPLANGIVADEIRKRNGTSGQFLKADGSVDDTEYFPKTGGNVTAPMSVQNGVRFAYQDGIAYVQFGSTESPKGKITTWNAGQLESLDVYTKSWDAFTLNGQKIWCAGNDGAGSGLDADLLDGKHASDFYATKKLFEKSDYRRYVVLLWKENEIGVHRINGKIYTMRSGGNRYQAANIDMFFSRWDTGPNYNESLRLDTFGQGTAWKLVTCTYNGESWYALQHTNIQATSAYFIGTSEGVDFTAIHYYTSNPATVVDSSINSSIVDKTSSLSKPYIGNNAYALVSDNVASANKLISRVLTTGDLNDFKGAGSHFNTYYGPSGNTVLNKPTGIDEFGLQVIQISNTKVVQILFDNGGNIFKRIWDTSAWSAWKEFVFTDSSALTSKATLWTIGKLPVFSTQPEAVTLPTGFMESAKIGDAVVFDDSTGRMAGQIVFKNDNVAWVVAEDQMSRFVVAVNATTMTILREDNFSEFLTASDVANYVTTDTQQDINAQKTFKKTTRFEGAVYIDSMPELQNPESIVVWKSTTKRAYYVKLEDLLADYLKKDDIPTDYPMNVPTRWVFSSVPSLGQTVPLTAAPVGFIGGAEAGDTVVFTGSSGQMVGQVLTASTNFWRIVAHDLSHRYIIQVSNQGIQVLRQDDFE